MGRRGVSENGPSRPKLRGGKEEVKVVLREERGRYENTRRLGEKKGSNVCKNHRRSLERGKGNLSSGDSGSVIIIRNVFKREEP